jgi:hypothetical protein
MTDRLNRRFFQAASTGERLMFTEHYTWAVVGSLAEFQCDEDTEHPIDADGKPIKGSYIGQPS